MEVEVVVPVDFNFDSNCSSPYITAPSSPQRFGNFFLSAPTSPTRPSPFFNNDFSRSRHSSSSSVPFHWEEKPGVPKSKPTDTNDENEDFEFDFGGNLERTSLSADELFDGGKIRPLKPPPRLQSGGDGLSSPVSNVSSPRSRISQGKKIVQEAFSPRNQSRDFDPFAAAMEETRKRVALDENQQSSRQGQEQKRGRQQRASSFSYFPTNSFLSSFSFSKGYRNWRIKDFLLFRSASEGRATDKGPLRKYEILSKKVVEEDVKNSSFRSTESLGSVSKRRGAVSAHELHYTVNRAASEEMKKKTFLPYKQGLLGCLGFNPGGVHDISKGIGSLARS